MAPPATIATLNMSAKTIKSKFFRVAVEGATTDGRNIERSWIEQMARNFNTATYGARVWCEHMRGLYPDSTFSAYGDVVAVKAEEVDIQGKKKLALFAQIDALPSLVELANQKKQKIYTSVEINPKFADTGEAYLIGLGITDSPASLGTEVLSFAAQHPDASPFKDRKLHPGNMFSAAEESTIELDVEEDPKDGGVVAKFSQQIREALGRFKAKGKDDDSRFGEVANALSEVGSMFASHAEQSDKAIKELRAEVAKFAKAHGELVTRLESTPAANHTQRPPASGGNGAQQTDC